jgi:hypothetical protein
MSMFCETVSLSGLKMLPQKLAISAHTADKLLPKNTNIVSFKDVLEIDHWQIITNHMQSCQEAVSLDHKDVVFGKIISFSIYSLFMRNLEWIAYET